mgnify:CR=1 FL=1
MKQKDMREFFMPLIVLDAGHGGGWSEIQLLFYKSSNYAGYRIHSTMR